jgi:tRNA nucleotidyltransferase (CCA-adding enzyme)
MHHPSPIAARHLQNIPTSVLWVLEQLRSRGKRGWLVGGCVRDMLGGRQPSDWDVATNALPKEMLKIFPRVIPTGIAHGTVTVLNNGTAIEVTTLRGEGEYKDGRRPERIVFLDDIEADLARRDFTFNAVALDPLAQTITDPFEGQKDLEANLLRAVGNPLQRFTEDGLRILRAARFAATLECQIEAETLAAMAHPDALATYGRVAAERIQAEWLKALRAPRPSIAFTHMLQSGMLAITCPELQALVATKEPEHGSLWDRNMAVLDAAPAIASVRLAALLRDCAPPSAAKGKSAKPRPSRILRRLKFSNDHGSEVDQILQNVDTGDTSSWSLGDIRRWLSSFDANNFTLLSPLLMATYSVSSDPDRPPVCSYPDFIQRCQEQLDAGHPLRANELAIDGNGLMAALEIAPGPRLGQLLRSLLQLVLDDPSCNRRERLLEEARRQLDTQG